MRAMQRKMRFLKYFSGRLKGSSLLIIVFLPLLINMVMAGVIWLHVREHWSFHNVVGLSALLFFGLLPLIALFLVDAVSIESCRKWQRRRRLRVLRPEDPHVPKSH